MNTVTSADGTTIGYSKAGSGPPVLLVDGALCSRAMGPAPALVKQLQDRFTVYSYDRRGRGESSDTQPYAVEREVEDIAALVAKIGDPPYVFGQSSGGALALEAANTGVPMAKLAIYEVPFVVDPSGPAGKDEQYKTDLDAALDAGRRSEAVRLFMRLVGAPGFMITVMRLTPVWSKLKAVAHTLPYDHAVLEGGRTAEPLPADRYSDVKVPALVMAGGKSDEWFRNAARDITKRVTDAEYRTIEGQDHMLKAKVIDPVLRGFFS